ncbi:hypothetical protein K491DRAFT_731289 [Lophiostoma macrostomum CBS 122681]|uniref:Uncharacterized protein n=1 Tax=Lophiostoma macrostomum CBS 122681 TaxID=1314788 RepID=A0A6A6SRV6_9PLEO|nr:hypothetical protein K491DRAFT_731289 [Lophiostoma macrostomum CBS 122681]
MCVGAKSQDGSACFVNSVVPAVSAAADGFVDIEGQLVAKGRTVGHVKCEEGKREKYSEMPIVAHLEGGMISPPQEDGGLKIGAMEFVTNFEGTSMSLPRYTSENRGDGVRNRLKGR